MKKIISISIVIFFVQTNAWCQKKVNFSSFVNAKSPATSLNYVPKNYAPNQSIDIEYGDLGLNLGCTIIRQNIKETMSFMVEEYMIPYIAQNYTQGGSWENRLKLANLIFAHIASGYLPIANNPQANYMNNEPFANDFRLFRDITNSPSKNYRIQDSQDTEIPINIISNHPLLLVNGNREPHVISTSKSIQIK